MRQKRKTAMEWQLGLKLNRIRPGNLEENLEGNLKENLEGNLE